MKQRIIALIRREEVALLPYAAGTGVAALEYIGHALDAWRPSGELNTFLALGAGLAVKALIVVLQKRAAVPPPP